MMVSTCFMPGIKPTDCSKRSTVGDRVNLQFRELRVKIKSIYVPTLD